MIGFSAFMMPWARIKTFFWFLHVARSYAIPAWVLAGWYIGWDIYDLFTRTENSTINFLAHVSGGITGYAMGYLFFKKEKEAGQYELDVEIDFMRAKRESFSNIATLYKGDRTYVDSKQREHDAKKEYGKFNEQLYKNIKVGNTEVALSSLIEKYDLFEESPELYIELFNDIGEWKKKRVYLCTGRLILDLLVEKKKYADIPYIVKKCLEVDDQFILADPNDLLFVVNYLVSVNEYEFGYQLLHQASDKYGATINHCDGVLLEARLLWSHLDKGAEAQTLLESSMREFTAQDKVKAEVLLALVANS